MTGDNNDWYDSTTKDRVDFTNQQRSMVLALLLQSKSVALKTKIAELVNRNWLKYKSL